MKEKRPPMKENQRLLFLVLFLAFIIRGGILFVHLDTFNADPDNYRALAENLRQNGVFGEGTSPTAFRPPLYPILLRSAFVFTPSDIRSSQEKALKNHSDNRLIRPFSLLLTKNAAIALLHWILGLATAGFVYWLALLFHFSPKGAAAAALLTTIDPILLQQSRLVMTETAAAFFAAAMICLLIQSVRKTPRKRQRLAFFGVGLFAGFAALCRPAFIAFIGLIFFALVLYELCRTIPLGSPALFLFGAFLILLPWGIRNHAVFGKWIFSTTHGGYTLLLANNESLYAWNQDPGPFAGPWNPEKFHRDWEEKRAKVWQEKGLTPLDPEAELAQDAAAKELAKNLIREKRGDFLWASAIRVGNLWQFLPYRTEANSSSNAEKARYAVGFFYAAELTFAFLGLFAVLSLFVKRRPDSPVPFRYPSDWIWPILLILSVQIPHLIYWTNMRMRAPLMTVIPLLAIVGAAEFIRPFRKRKDKDPTASLQINNKAAR